MLRKDKVYVKTDVSGECISPPDTVIISEECCVTSDMLITELSAEFSDTQSSTDIMNNNKDNKGQ